MRQQDIEIYIRGSARGDIEQWLASIFEQLELQQQAGKNYGGNARLNQASPRCEFMLLENAVKGYTSLWFKKNHTPWDSDIDCARSAYQYLQREVRASTGSWSEGAEEDLFCRIDDSGETTIEWPNP
jgi:hypothetical protein